MSIALGRMRCFRGSSAGTPELDITIVDALKRNGANSTNRQSKLRNLPRRRGTVMRSSKPHLTHKLS